MQVEVTVVGESEKVLNTSETLTKSQYVTYEYTYPESGTYTINIRSGGFQQSYTYQVDHNRPSEMVLVTIEDDGIHIGVVS